jgi:hypothetical protein
MIDNPILEMVEGNYKKFKKLVPDSPIPGIKSLAGPLLK